MIIWWLYFNLNDMNLTPYIDHLRNDMYGLCHWWARHIIQIRGHEFFVDFLIRGIKISVLENEVSKVNKSKNKRIKTAFK